MFKMSPPVVIGLINGKSNRGTSGGGRSTSYRPADPEDVSSHLLNNTLAPLIKDVRYTSGINEKTI